MTEPPSQVTYTENFVKFGRVFSRYSSGQTDKQTNTVIAILRTPTGGDAKRT